MKGQATRFVLLLLCLALWAEAIINVREWAVILLILFLLACVIGIVVITLYGLWVACE